MAYKFEYSPGIEADRRLLPFDNYEKYLDSLVLTEDLRNLRSIKTARIIAELGYRSHGETLTEAEFDRRRGVIQEVVHPSVKPHFLAGSGHFSQDPLVKELAIRERENRADHLHTLIFIRLRNKSGHQMSAYIDYAERLLSEDWRPFFHEGKLLKPLPTDLSYYFWRHGIIHSNISKNFKPMITKRGLTFQNRYDHKIIYIDPNFLPGSNTTRHRIHSKNYAQIELYDHIVRQKT